MILEVQKSTQQRSGWAGGDTVEKNHMVGTQGGPRAYFRTPAPRGGAPQRLSPFMAPHPTEFPSVPVVWRQITPQLGPARSTPCPAGPAPSRSGLCPCQASSSPWILAGLSLLLAWASSLFSGSVRIVLRILAPKHYSESSQPACRSVWPQLHVPGCGLTVPPSGWQG